jgi:translation initiation factor IF-2
MLTPKFEEIVNGQCEVRNVFKITGAGIVAGCYVTSGKILRNSNVRVLRDNTVVYDSTIGSLKRIKDDVKEVATGYECGVTISGFSDFKVGDVLESYTLEKIE